MPNGDIVSGCSDGVVRIFSESEDRWESADALKSYDEQVASQALPTQQVGDVKKSDLPGPEALNVPGVFLCTRVAFYLSDTCIKERNLARSK